MAKTRSLDDAMDKYKGSGGGFFSLEDDKDTAVVRFLIGSELVPEEDWFVVHPIQIDGKKRWMQCTEEGDCPGCRQSKPQIKVFAQLEDSEGEIKVWERGRKFVPTLTKQISNNGPLYNRLYEVERNGVKNDTNTKYELYAMDPDGVYTPELVAEKKQTLLSERDKNGLVLNLSHDNMVLAIQGKYVPPKEPKDGEESTGGQSNNSSGQTQTRPRERTVRSSEDVF